MAVPSGVQSIAESRGFLSSSSCIGTIRSRVLLATSITYQPLRLVASRRAPSRLNETGLKDSSCGDGGVEPSVGAGAAALSAAASDFAGRGVKLRGLPLSTVWTKISPRLAYANVRPSSDHRSW